MNRSLRWMVLFIGFAAGLVFFLKGDRTTRQFIADSTMPLRHGLIRESGIQLSMRDGVKLNTRVYKPLSFSADQYPVILMRTTYGAFDFNITKRFVESDYVVVEQFVRGRYGSEGDYSPHRYSGRDGYDTLEWIVSQDWSNGKVGTFGCSYLGEVQIALAKEKHPNHLAAIADAGAGLVGKLEQNYGYFGFYENGVLNLVSSLSWFSENGLHGHSGKAKTLSGRSKAEIVSQLPVSELDERLAGHQTIFDDFVLHDLGSDWWEEEGYVDEFDTFTTPTLHLNAWFDQGIQGTFDLQKGMIRNAQNSASIEQPMVIGPGNHCQSGKMKTGIQTIGTMDIDYVDIDYWQLYLDWFGYWLKDGKGKLPKKYNFYEIHGRGWLHSNDWKGDLNYQSFYLDEARTLTESYPNKELSLSYLYDPLDPAPTLGGTICCTGNEEDISGPVPQNKLIERHDVLWFQTSALEDKITLLGAPKTQLQVSTSALDTDFTVKLLDIYPDGRAFSINDSVLRMRYRNSYRDPELVTPNQKYSVTVRLRPISYTILPGHKVGLMISSSNFPRLARNLNTGLHEYSSDEIAVAKNSVYLGGEDASVLQLPIVSAE